MTLPRPSGPDVDALVADVRDALDVLANDHSDYDKCRLCPLGMGSVCFPNCAAWKSSRTALDSLAALARSAADMEEALRAYAEGDPLAPLLAQHALAVRSREQQEGT